MQRHFHDSLSCLPLPDPVESSQPAPQPSHPPSVQRCTGKITSPQSPQKSLKRERKSSGAHGSISINNRVPDARRPRHKRIRGLSSKWGSPTPVCPGNVWHRNCDRSHAHLPLLTGAISTTRITGAFQVKSAPHRMSPPHLKNGKLRHN